MKSTYSEFMQSKYFDGLFNAAIFDGPFRIYFHQNYESLALKIYFLLGQNLADVNLELRDFTRRHEKHVFFLIYPDQEKLNLVFSSAESLTEFAKYEKWDHDLVIGLQSQFLESEMAVFIKNCETQIREWVRVNSEQLAHEDNIDNENTKYLEPTI